MCIRDRIQSAKVNIGARIKVNGVMLLELHLNPANVHQNPDGRKITGSHWHISVSYTHLDVYKRQLPKHSSNSVSHGPNELNGPTIRS